MIFNISYNLNNASSIMFDKIDVTNIRVFVKEQCDCLKEATFDGNLSRATISIEGKEDEWVILFNENRFSYIKNNGEATDRDDFCKLLTSQKNHINGHNSI